MAEYEIVRVLGAGGFGITYLAFDHQLDGPVAIKEYFPAELATRLDDDQVAATGSTVRADGVSGKSGTEIFAWGLKRFLDEARTVHRFRHPNVVQARRYLEANGTAYLVMEYVEGESLRSILNRCGSLSTQEWHPWMDALLEGLEHVHSHGYLHRDIKPANIVVRSEDGEPVLIDFGAARLQHRDRTHTQVLTAAYAPIEQHSTGAAQGPPTDIYALAATSYRVLTGTRPSSAPDRILKDDYEPLADRLAGSERQRLAAIDHGLAVRPENRPQTVEAWRAELGTGAGSAPPKSSTDRPGTAEPTIRAPATPAADSVDAPPRLARRRPAVALGALLLFGLVALSVVLLTEGISPDGTLESEPSLDPPGQVAPADTVTVDPPPGEEEKPLGSFRVVAEPSNSRVEFLNSEASYVPGMPLPPGQYRVQVSAPGHRSSETAIEHGASSTVLRIDLTAEAEAASDSNVLSPNPPAGEGDADARFELGREISNSPVSTAHDESATIEWYREAADQGHAEAQFSLGVMYDKGNGAPQDYGEAAAWYRKAADQGHAVAQLRLGNMYSRGEGLPQDDAEAAVWFRKAADQGNTMAQVGLGFMYANGTGVPQDDRKAVAWYQKAAEQGSAAAQVMLGTMYASGAGVPQDDRKAVAWYQKAAEQGSAVAQYALGSMYANGKGVPVNAGEAVTWYSKAAEQGQAEAQFNLGVMYDKGNGAPQDYEEAAAWYRKAADQGHAVAQLRLGNMYSLGEGLPHDYVRAYAWLNIAAEQGHAQAEEHRDRIGNQMTREQISRADRLSRDLVSQ